MKTKLKFNNGGTIMKKMNLRIMCLIAFMMSFFSISEAQVQVSVNATITSDNAYVIGFGDNLGITDYRLPGVCNLTNKMEIYGPNMGTETYNWTTLTSNRYVYIGAWADQSTFQGLIAQFALGTTPIVTGPIPSINNPNIVWEVYATDTNLFPQSNDPFPISSTTPPYIPRGNSNCPPLGAYALQDVNTINGQIAIANANAGGAGTSIGWVREPSFTAFNAGKVGVLAIGPTNATAIPFPPDIVTGIVSNAQWMWYFRGALPIPNITDPFVSPAPTGGYFIFRLGPLDSIPVQDTIMIEHSDSITGGCLGKIKIVASGGTAPYQYRIKINGNWFAWGTSDTFINLPSDTYEFEVKDSNGNINSTTITIAPSPVVTITANNGPPCCPTATVTGGTPFANPPYYTYSWTGPNGFTATTKDPPCPAQTSSGIYENGTYQLIVTDSAGCTDTATILIDCGCVHICDYWALGGNSEANGGKVSDKLTPPDNNNWIFERSNILGINDMNSNGNLIPSPPNLSPLRIFTNSTEKMRILSTGEVGIGIENPSKKLQVHNGAILLTGTNSMGGPMIVFGDKTPTTTNPIFQHPNGNWGIEYDPTLGVTGGLNFWKPFGSAGGFDNNILFLSNNGNVGIGKTPFTSYKLDVNGHLRIIGGVLSNGNAITSDSTLKQNINIISNALGTINQLHPKTFDFKVNEFPYLNLPTGNQIGFIAQEVQNVFPNLVENFNYAEETDTSGNVIIPASTFKGLNYIGFIPIAIKGIQELDSIVSDLSASGLNASGPLTTNYLTKTTGINTIGNSQIFDNDSCVGIGTNILPAGYKMVIEGKLGARDVLVACPPTWPDYVFSSKYKMKPLNELDHFIKTNKHLPGIPSQNEIEKAGGLNLGEMQTKQMEKIEELYLYIIEMNKDMEKLSLENKALRDRVKMLESK